MIEPLEFKKAIELLKKYEDEKPSEEEFFRMIALLGSHFGRGKTLASKYLPKDTIIIGTGEPIDFFTTKPHTFQTFQK